MHDLPIGLATMFSMALFASLGIACMTLGREQAFMDAPDRQRWRDLRLWALVVILAQMGLYYSLQ